MTEQQIGDVASIGTRDHFEAGFDEKGQNDVDAGCTREAELVNEPGCPR